MYILISNKCRLDLGLKRTTFSYVRVVCVNLPDDFFKGISMEIKLDSFL